MERRKRRSFTPEFRAEAVRRVRKGTKPLPQVAKDLDLTESALLCTQLGVSRSGYSAWKERPESKREQADRELAEQGGAVHPHSRGTYGSPRVHAELRARGRKVSRKRVARLMSQQGLASSPMAPG